MDMMYYDKEEFVPLNWDKLVKNPDVFEAIKEEMDKKFSAECLMTIITAAKEAGLKDKDIFLPVEAEMEEEEEPKEEYESLFEDSIGNTIED
jgi:hypothetical protein